MITGDIAIVGLILTVTAYLVRLTVILVEIRDRTKTNANEIELLRPVKQVYASMELRQLVQEREIRELETDLRSLQAEFHRYQLGKQGSP